MDAVAFGFLANLLWAPMEPSLQQAAQQLGNLEPYCQRLRERLFPEPRE